MTLLYKCRMCGGVVEGHSGPSHVIDDIMMELMAADITTQFTGRITVRRFCRHKDGSIGVADLIGARKEITE